MKEKKSLILNRDFYIPF